MMFTSRTHKEILCEYLPMATENKNRMDRLSDMRDAAGGIGGAHENDGSTHTIGNSHKLERAVERYLEYEKKITPLIIANKKKMTEIEETVDALPDHLQREVLRLRYLDGDGCRPMRWSEVAQAIYGDDDRKYTDAVLRLHKKALESLNFSGKCV